MSMVSSLSSGFAYSPSSTNIPSQDGVSQAEQMKAIQKQKLAREVLADPSKAAKLVQQSASPVYNASGNLIQTSGSLS